MEMPAAIYARVSSDRQKESQTIASQTVALTEYAKAHGYLVPAEWVFEDDGYSGASLTRPGLEAVRDLAAQGQIEALLIHSPDRLSGPRSRNGAGAANGTKRNRESSMFSPARRTGIDTSRRARAGTRITR